jgi:hypothetical protein
VGSATTILQEFGAAIITESLLPANADGTGGTSFVVDPVLYGDENLNQLQGQHGRVVLTIGDGEVSPAKRMRSDLQTLATWTPIVEAHLWVPIGEIGTRTSLQRFDALEALLKVVLRAWYGTIVNSNSAEPARALAEGVEIKRDTKHLRNGQAAVVTFALSIPVCRGRTLATFPAGIRGPLTVVANPE